MHEQELEVLDVVDEEGLVARGHHVAGLLVGTEADLSREYQHHSIPNRCAACRLEPRPCRGPADNPDQSKRTVGI